MDGSEQVWAGNGPGFALRYSGVLSAGTNTGEHRGQEKALELRDLGSQL